MLEQPRYQEIDHRTIKLLVGVIALTLANLTSFLAGVPLPSISASYYAGGWAQTIFVGFLFAIAAFMLAYNGQSRLEMVLSKLAAVAALGVALFPCRCGTHDEIIPHVHALAAAAMFMILAGFCLIFHARAVDKGWAQARWRAGIYVACGTVMLGAMGVLVADYWLHGSLGAAIPRLTFHGERAALMAFGVSWLTASRTLPGITRSDERFSPFNNRCARELPPAPAGAAREPG